MSLIPSRDWTYLAEGGKNVVFCYTGEDDTVWRNKVLRVAKSDLAICGSNNNSKRRREDHDHDDCDSEQDERFIIQKDDDDDYDFPSLMLSSFCEQDDLNPEEDGVNFFVQHVVRPSLGEPYVDLSRPVKMSRDFAARLHQDTIARNCIPPHRLNSWHSKPPSFHRGDTGTTPSTISAFLLTNHASSFSSSSCGNNDEDDVVVCSVEVKPKGASVTRSPLVHALHRIKLVQPNCRFTHMQTRKKERRLRSGYNPQQLFSLHLPHMQESCQQLSRHAQNNLQVWFHGKPLLPSRNNTVSTTATATSTTRQIWSQIWTDLVMEDGEDNTNRQTSEETNTNTSEKAQPQEFVLQRLVPQILKQEGKLLQNILHLQHLDVVDADGAILIYHHLVQTHCRGSMDDADQLIDDYFPCDCSTKLRFKKENNVTGEPQEQQQPSSFDNLVRCLTPSQCLDRYSPFPKPMGEDVDDFLEELDRFASHVSSIVIMEYNRREVLLDTSLQTATHLVNRLSLDACVYLLRNWLLSLAMCDISLFVSISKNKTPSGTDRSTCSDGRIGAQKTMTQTTDRSGCLQIPLPDHADEKNDTTSCCMERMVSCRYTVKVVDCDAKPAHKLRSRHEKELIFRAIFE
eukprot:scaffold53544_cov53-Attheya_sp.AAC.5